DQPVWRQADPGNCAGQVGGERVSERMIYQVLSYSLESRPGTVANPLYNRGSQHRVCRLKIVSHPAKSSINDRAGRWRIRKGAPEEQSPTETIQHRCRRRGYLLRKWHQPDMERGLIVNCPCEPSHIRSKFITTSKNNIM